MLLDALFGRSRLSTHGKGDILERWLLSGLWGGGKTKAGTSVNEDTALTYAPYWCGCRILCEAESSLPLFTYERLANDDRVTANEHWLFDLLWRAPNPDMPSGPFREGRTLDMIGRGNGFAEIEWDSDVPAMRTQAVALWPIHASRVRPVYSNGPHSDLYRQGFRYLVRNNDGSDMPLKADEMLHLPGIFPLDGLWGLGCVQYHRETLGFGLATEQYGATYFGSGGHPRSVIEGLGLKDKDQRDHFRREWKEMHGDPNSSDVAILPPNSKLTLLNHMTNENAQFLATRKMNVAQVARILRVPVYMLEEYEKAASFASVEIRGIDFIVYSLMPWLRRWEEQINHKLILPIDRGRIFAEHLLAGLLRGDFKTRMEGYVQALMNGIMTLNEVRRLENLKTIGPAGDVNYVAMNLTTAERMLAGPPEKAMLRNNDGAQDADAFTREMLAKMREQARKVLGKSRKRKAALQLGHTPAPNPAALRAARAVLADVLGRMFAKEAHAAARAVNAKGDFDAWLAEFYGKHEALLAEALGPAAEVLASLGRSTTAAALAAELTAESKALLRDGYDRQTKEQFLTALETWPAERAAAKADAILAKSVEQPGVTVQLVRQETHHHTVIEQPKQEIALHANLVARLESAAQEPPPAPNVQVDVHVSPTPIENKLEQKIEIKPADNVNQINVTTPKIASVEQTVHRDRDGEMSGTTSEYWYEEDK